MILSPAYEKSRHQAILEGMQIGLLLGLQQSLQSDSQKIRLDKQRIEYLLNLRFKVDEALSQLIEPLAQMPMDESLPLLLHGSREELVARFGKKDSE